MIEKSFEKQPPQSLLSQLGVHVPMLAIAALLIGSIMPLMTPPRAVQAASVQLYMSSAVSSVEKGATFSVSVRMNASGEFINAVQADFTYPAGSMEFIGIGADSDFGIPAPSNGSGGNVSIGRGNAGGIDGDRLVAVVAFKALADTGSAALAFSGTSQALRSSDNSDALTSTSGLSFNFTAPPIVDSTPAPSPAIVPTPTPKPNPAPVVKPAPAPATPPATPMPATVTPAPVKPPQTIVGMNNNQDEDEPAAASPNKSADDSPVSGKVVAAGVSGIILLAAAVGGVIVFRRRVQVGSSKLDNGPNDSPDLSGGPDNKANETTSEITGGNAVGSSTPTASPNLALSGRTDPADSIVPTVEEVAKEPAEASAGTDETVQSPPRPPFVQG